MSIDLERIQVTPPTADRESRSGRTGPISGSSSAMHRHPIDRRRWSRSFAGANRDELDAGGHRCRCRSDRLIAVQVTAWGCSDVPPVPNGTTEAVRRASETGSRARRYRVRCCHQGCSASSPARRIEDVVDERVQSRDPLSDRVAGPAAPSPLRTIVPFSPTATKPCCRRSTGASRSSFRWCSPTTVPRCWPHHASGADRDVAG